MAGYHVHEALRQVRELRQRILESQMFTGYSGIARALGGLAAVGAAVALSRPWFPQTERGHIAGWLVTGALAAAVNYAGLFHWFLTSREAKRDIRRLMPAIDPLPPLTVGALLTVALIGRGAADALPGMWMCMYGLTNLSSRRALPASIWVLGCYYVAAGALFLFVAATAVVNPWPMGLVFGAGELAGRAIFAVNRFPNGIRPLAAAHSEDAR